MSPRGKSSEYENGDEAKGRRGKRSVGRIASGHDRTGTPIHHGWAPLGGRRRWMEPFMLVLLAEGAAHGYALVGQLEEMGIANASQLDFGQVYRTLRDLEDSGLVTSSWSSEPVGPQRREYELTDAGHKALDEWAAVMRERARLMAEFDGRYLSAVARPPRRSSKGD